jgi:hypothetical protein
MFFFFLFSFYKIREQEGRTGPAQKGMVPVEVVRWWGKGVGG